MFDLIDLSIFIKLDFIKYIFGAFTLYGVVLCAKLLIFGSKGVK